MNLADDEWVSVYTESHLVHMSKASQAVVSTGVLALPL